MPYKIFPLPTPPIQVDMWDMLKKETRPIMVYGMGNGADKLFERFEQYGIDVKEVFASDGFVRGHSYRGYKVKSFSEIKENYPEFVIVLSFASNRAEVVDMLAEIDSQYDMIVPDMPVADTSEYFDKEFYNQHYDEIIQAYESLADDESRAVFSSVINYKLTGKMKYLLSVYSTRDEIYSLMPRNNIETVVDAGAYNGDTAREAKEYFPNLKRIFAIEPDKRNFKKLVKYSEAESDLDIIPINSAAWSDNGIGSFSESGNRNSTAVATASFEHRNDEISFIKIDSITDSRIDYIKYDVEGAELQAIEGSSLAISRHYPCLLISLYHRSRDIFELVNFIKNNYSQYTLFLRRLRCLPAWEIDLICIKNEAESERKQK
jgi:FkbM family methyltransferase